MAVVDADSGKVVTTVPIGDHGEAAAFDPDSRLRVNKGSPRTPYLPGRAPDLRSVRGNG
jgi:hypothetical protein